jgi:hypothetical protein
MTQKQKLQRLRAAATQFKELVNVFGMIKRGKFSDETGDYLKAVVESENALTQALALFDGSAE